MSIIHMEKEPTVATARKLALFCYSLELERQVLAQSAQSLPQAWQGFSQEQFQIEMEELLQALSRSQAQLESLLVLFQQEIAQWEEGDRWDGGAMLGTAFMPGIIWLPAAGGTLAVSGFWIEPISTLSAAVSIRNLTGNLNLPAWLSALLNRIFPVETEPVVLPTPGVHVEEPESKEVLDNEPVPVPGTGQGGQYLVPTRSQGNLYGNAACAPTSVSMVLDYYHAQDPDNTTISPSELIAMMDAGDGTPGGGMSLSRLTDELNELGYNNISQGVNASMDTLRSELQQGPVIVTTGVGVVGPGTISPDVPRAITGPGSTMHAMVVTGISDSQVFVNDPWTGSRLTFSLEQFSRMWTNGQSGYYSIQP